MMDDRHRGDSPEGPPRGRRSAVIRTEARLKRSWTHVPVIMAVVSVLLWPADGLAPTKKLIEFGWDEPDPAFMRQHIAEMEASPFDGCVYHLTYRKPDGSEGLFIW